MMTMTWIGYNSTLTLSGLKVFLTIGDRTVVDYCFYVRDILLCVLCLNMVEHYAQF